MKKNIIKLASILTVVLFSSCSEQVLNLEPLNIENSKMYYDSEHNCFLAIVSCYRSMNKDYDNYSMIGDATTDDAVKGGANLLDWFDYQQVAEFTITGSGMSWYNLYDLVTKTNEVINALEEQETLSESKKIIIGEAKFLRAYAYSKLVMIYGRVPLFDHVILPSEFESVKRSATEKEVFDFIKTDLDDAIEVLPEKGDIEVGRATKGAAQALKARVCMRETGYIYNSIMSARAPEYSGINANDLWQEVYDLTKSIMNSGRYGLLPNYAEVFEIEGENREETVWDQQYVNDLSLSGRDESPGNLNGTRMGVRGFSGWGFNQPKDDLFHAFSRNGDRDPRRECTMISEEWPVGWGFNIVDSIMMGTNLSEYKWLTLKPEYDYTIYKSLRKGITSPKTGVWYRQIPTNIRVIRYSDVLLMNAEAAYYLGKYQEARAAVNTVRERARNSTYPPGCQLGDIDANQNPINYREYPNVNLPDINSSGTQLLDDIWHERRVELALEGLRYFDLIRTGRLEKLAYTDNYIAKKGLWPLPDNDVSSYGLEQNEGY